jgi:hypothetical protein
LPKGHGDAVGVAATASQQRCQETVPDEARRAGEQDAGSMNSHRRTSVPAFAPTLQSLQSRQQRRHPLADMMDAFATSGLDQIFIA